MLVSNVFNGLNKYANKMFVLFIEVLPDHEISCEIKNFRFLTSFKNILPNKPTDEDLHFLID